MLRKVELLLWVYQSVCYVIIVSSSLFHKPQMPSVRFPHTFQAVLVKFRGH